MPLNCEKHTAAIYDRGGMTRVGWIDPLVLAQWNRVRDDISTARVVVGARPSPECVAMLEQVEPNRHELVIFRGGARVWEGPISLVRYTRGTVEIEAKDVMYYAYRTVMHAEYNNNNPNVATVVNRAATVLGELSRKEALDPPINVLPHVRKFSAILHNLALNPRHLSTGAVTATTNNPAQWLVDRGVTVPATVNGTTKADGVSYVSPPGTTSTFASVYSIDGLGNTGPARTVRTLVRSTIHAQVRVTGSPVWRDIPAGQWVEVVLEVPAATYTVVEARRGDGQVAQVGDILWLTDTTTASQFFDGTTSGGSWDGAANASASTLDQDARTSRRTLAMQATVFEDIDSMAAKAGLDYTVIGRSILLFDTHTVIGQTRQVTEADFIGDVIVTAHGMEGATRSIVTDGQGNYGVYGGVDSFYGEWENLETAYNEDTDGTDIPTVPEMTSQARRNQDGRNPVPVIVRVPDNSRLNPSGVLTVDDLVPGVRIPLLATLTARTVNQMQKLDSVRVTETPGAGEVITVVLSPASADDTLAEED